MYHATPKQEYVAWLDKYIEEVKNGKENSLPRVYEYVSWEKEEVAQKAARSISEYVRNLSFKEIMHLNDIFRDRTSLEYYVDWRSIRPSSLRKKIGNDEDFLWVVRLGTFHPNGYFRAACIRELTSDPESLKFRILRLNDWAGPVREEAQRSCSDISRSSLHDLISALPYHERIVRGWRRHAKYAENLEAQLALRIRELAGDISWETVRDFDIPERKAFYRMFLTNKRLTKAEVKDILDHEKNSQCQMKIMSVFLDQYKLTIPELDEFLTHKSRLVQRKALDQKYAILQDSWEGIEKFLLSPSFGMRETVRFILRKHTSFDVRSFYIEHLDTKARKVCILGVGETGEKKDATLLEKYLRDPDVSVVKNTIHAIAQLNRNDSKELFWECLKDNRSPVKLQTYEEILPSYLHYGAKNIADLLDKEEDPIIRKKLVVLLVREPYWEYIPYILPLYNSEDEGTRNVVRRAMFHIRSAYASLSEEDAKRICEILDDPKNGIPERAREKIRFNMKGMIR